jgi:hypothetical protein
MQSSMSAGTVSTFEANPRRLSSFLRNSFIFFACRNVPLNIFVTEEKKLNFR